MPASATLRFISYALLNPYISYIVSTSVRARKFIGSQTLINTCSLDQTRGSFVPGLHEGAGTMIHQV